MPTWGAWLLFSLRIREFLPNFICNRMIQDYESQKCILSVFYPTPKIGDDPILML
jgi:hypothetical protein